MSKENQIKWFFVGLAVIAVFVIVYKTMVDDRHYSFADLSVTEPTSLDCLSIKDQKNHSVTISLSAKNVSSIRDKIKTLITKYDGVISNDSFNSYPNSSGSSDNANLVVTFAKSQKEFLSELGELTKSMGVSNNNYSFYDGSQQYGYSPYSACLGMVQNVALYKEQLELFNKSLKREHDPKVTVLLGMSISAGQSSLQNAVNSLNDFFKQSNNPSVNINIYTTQTLPFLPTSPTPMMQN